MGTEPGEMSLAILCPIGFVRGYEPVWRECVQSMARAADQVYLVLSTREDVLTGLPKGVTVLCDERTWFARTPSGASWFDAHRVMENVNTALAQARADGHTQAACIFCNWYVSEGAAAALRQPVADWGWVYRKDYLAGQMFHASTALPFLVNTAAPVRFAADALVVDGEPILWIKADFRERDGEAVVDYQLELDAATFRERMVFMRGYRDLVPKRPAGYDWSYWRDYYSRRYRLKTPSQERPEFDPVQPGFVSQAILRAL